MKTSIKWLSDYVKIPWDAPQLAQELTLAGLEVGSITELGQVPLGIVIAKIIALSGHPNANKLTLCTVDAGDENPITVVCGAANCAVGAKVALARTGTTMPSGMVIKECQIRGATSLGMLCSQSELGCGDDDSGIWILPPAAPVGTRLSDYLATDSVIEWEITPNRRDWLSHIGIAREVAALTGNTLHLPDAVPPPPSGADISAGIKITVTDPHACPRYTARVIRNLRVGPSPDWLQSYLKSVGHRPINNVVDITNFVMLECGQPLHAFDLQKLEGNKISIRRAQPGEQFAALDQKDYELDENALIIADAANPVALAGIIGGRDSAITASTTDIVLESAAFNPVVIRATAKRLAIMTDSSYRFERGFDWDMVEFASCRAAKLICDYAGGELQGEMIDIARLPPRISEITCRYHRVRRLLGITISSVVIRRIFTRLGLTIIRHDRQKCVVGIPSFRMDLTREVDLIEEIARIHGLNNIVADNRGNQAVAAIQDDAYLPHQLVRTQLLNLGLTECLNYSLVNDRDLRALTPDLEARMVKLKNPLTQDHRFLRPTLLFNLIRNLEHNIAHGNINLRLFEIGRVFANDTTGNDEAMEAVIMLTGLRHQERYSEEKTIVCDFYDLRGLVEDWLALRQVTDFSIIPASHPYFHPGICAELQIAQKTMGILGELSASLLASIRVKTPVYAAIMDVDALLSLTPLSTTYRVLPLFPAIARDVAFAAEENLTHQQVIDCIRQRGGEFLETIDMIDIYRDNQAIGAGKKSMAYSLTFRSTSRTLTDDEINNFQEKIRHALCQDLGVTLR